MARGADPIVIPDAVLANHTAVLGKTGSGKTSTTKLAIEQVVAEGYRVCILDTVKSDWWGMVSSADGKKPGLPFRILGGPHGHIALPSSAGAAVGRLVGSGKLPLSIVDMADFEPGGIQHFFVEFAAALMRSMKGVLYLVIEEAHEVAPKERAGFGAENMAIHWAKKLATAGRSKGIRLIVATQRVQALHNAVLGSCETLIAHRLSTPADQDPVLKWVKANIPDKDIQRQVAESLSSLPTGTGWLCSGEAQIFQRMEFPKFKTFDNTATPTNSSDEIRVKTAPVDHDELRSIIGDAVKEAEDNDPKLLKAEIVKLNRELAAEKRRKGAPDWPDQREEVRQLRDEVSDLAGYIALQEARIAAVKAAIELPAGAKKPTPRLHTPDPKKQVVPPNVSPPAPMTSTDEQALSGSQRQFLSALAWWEAIGHPQPTRAQTAAIAGWRITSGHLKNVSESLGLIDYPRPGHFALTDAGRQVAPAPDTSRGLHDSVRATLNGSQQQVFDFLVRADDRAQSVTRDLLARSCGWEPTSGHVKNVLGSLKTLQVIDYPEPGHVALQGWLQ
jgi:hypothetical protein